MKADLFNTFYEEIYGSRWEFLRTSLIDAGKKNNKVSLGNNTDFAGNDLVFELDGLRCSSVLSDQFYQLDLASVLAVSSLSLSPKQKILDLCAAPGGKSLVSQFLTGGVGEWHLNEMSQPRLSRMKSVMREFSLVDEERIFFYKRDASKWGLMEQNIYDTVLCDVPCSGEAHLLNSPTHLKKWTPKSSKNLSIRQHAILCAALEAVKPGGEILYSTCSVQPRENDGVIGKFLKKRGSRATVKTLNLKFLAEPTQYGYNIFPDKTEIGPIYFCVLQKY